MNKYLSGTYRQGVSVYRIQVVYVSDINYRVYLYTVYKLYMYPIYTIHRVYLYLVYPKGCIRIRYALQDGSGRIRYTLHVVSVYTLYKVICIRYKQQGVTVSGIHYRLYLNQLYTTGCICIRYTLQDVSVTGIHYTMCICIYTIQHCDLKVSRSQAKIYENFANYFLKSNANSKCVIVSKSTLS